MAEKLVTVATYWDVNEAHLARVRLEQEGIKPFLQDENVAALGPFRTSGVKLQVKASDAGRAIKILGEEPGPDDAA